MQRLQTPSGRGKQRTARTVGVGLRVACREVGEVPGDSSCHGHMGAPGAGLQETREQSMACRQCFVETRLWRQARGPAVKRPSRTCSVSFSWKEDPGQLFTVRGPAKICVFVCLTNTQLTSSARNEHGVFSEFWGNSRPQTASGTEQGGARLAEETGPDRKVLC